ncbi:MAG: DoxX family protein [Pyrinomonadaceae bacterium]
MSAVEKNSMTTVDQVSSKKPKRTTNYILWIIQVLLALVFLFTGIIKLVLPIQSLQGPVHLPAIFLRFLGVAEVLGGLGLVLPGLFHIQERLTPLAGLGLVIIMIGATVITVMSMGVPPAILPAIAGILSALVAYSRW